MPHLSKSTLSNGVLIVSGLLAVTIILWIEYQHHQHTLELATQLKTRLDTLRTLSDETSQAYKLARSLENEVESLPKWPLLLPLLVMIGTGVRSLFKISRHKAE